MEYVGLQSQIRSNNRNSTILLIMFPTLLLSLTWLFCFIAFQGKHNQDLSETTDNFYAAAPLVLGAVGLWFLIAYSSHSVMITRATSAKPLERKENMRVYNLVENLCIARGMKTPKINIIEDDSLNAFASGINEKTYTVTLSRGIINRLDDAELEAVIAHELTHIVNRDVRLLIISIIFVGIFAFVAEVAFRSMRGSRRGKKDGKILLALIVVGVLGYILSLLLRFALSRKREYLADAGSAQWTKNPRALASALRKIDVDPRIEAVERRDIAQLFIDNPMAKEKEEGFSLSIGSVFATHPPIKKRIALLEQF